MVDLTKDYDQRHRAWYKIRNNRYLVSISTLWINRDKEIEENGMFSTGDRKIDQQLAFQKETIYMTLVDLINVYSNNGDFVFLHPNKDIPDIHRILQEHIDDFLKAEEMYSRGLYSEDQEVMDERRRDIVEIDAFAKDIYYKAYHKELDNNSPFKGLEKLSNPFADFNRKQETVVTPAYKNVSTHINYASLRERKRY